MLDGFEGAQDTVDSAEYDEEYQKEVELFNELKEDIGELEYFLEKADENSDTDDLRKKIEELETLKSKLSELDGERYEQVDSMSDLVDALKEDYEKIIEVRKSEVEEGKKIMEDLKENRIKNLEKEIKELESKKPIPSKVVFPGIDGVNKELKDNRILDALQHLSALVDSPDSKESMNALDMLKELKEKYNIPEGSYRKVYDDKGNVIKERDSWKEWWEQYQKDLDNQIREKKKILAELKQATKLKEESEELDEEIKSEELKLGNDVKFNEHSNVEGHDANYNESPHREPIVDSHGTSGENYSPFAFLDDIETTVRRYKQSKLEKQIFFKNYLSKELGAMGAGQGIDTLNMISEDNDDWLSRNDGSGLFVVLEKLKENFGKIGGVFDNDINPLKDWDASKDISAYSSNVDILYDLLLDGGINDLISGVYKKLPRMKDNSERVDWDAYNELKENGDPLHDVYTNLHYILGISNSLKNMRGGVNEKSFQYIANDYFSKYGNRLPLDSEQFKRAYNRAPKPETDTFQLDKVLSEIAKSGNVHVSDVQKGLQAFGFPYEGLSKDPDFISRLKKGRLFGEPIFETSQKNNSNNDIMNESAILLKLLNSLESGNALFELLIDVLQKESDALVYPRVRSSGEIPYLTSMDDIADLGVAGAMFENAKLALKYDDLDVLSSIYNYMITDLDSQISGNAKEIGNAIKDKYGVESDWRKDGFALKEFGGERISSSEDIKRIIESNYGFVEIGDSIHRERLSKSNDIGQIIRKLYGEYGGKDGSFELGDDVSIKWSSLMSELIKVYEQLTGKTFDNTVLEQFVNEQSTESSKEDISNNDVIKLSDPSCCKLLRETVEKINDNLIALKKAFESAKFVVNNKSENTVNPKHRDYTVTGFSAKKFAENQEKDREEKKEEINSEGRVNYTVRKQNLARWAEEAKDLEFREKAQKAFKVASEMTSPTGFNGRVANQDLVEGFLGEVPIEGYSTEDIKRFMQEHSEVKDKIEKASAFDIDDIISKITTLKDSKLGQAKKIRKGEYMKKREELENLLYELNPVYKEYVEINRTIELLEQEKRNKNSSGKKVWTKEDENELRGAYGTKRKLSKDSFVNFAKDELFAFDYAFNNFANSRGWLDNPILSTIEDALANLRTMRSQAFTEEEAEMYRLLDIAYSTVLGDNPPNPEGAIHGLYNSTILKVKKAILDDEGRKGNYNAFKNRMIGYEERLGDDDIKVDESTYVDIIKAIDKQKENISNAKTRVSKSTAKRKLGGLENLRDYLVGVIGADQAETWEYNWYNREEIDKQMREGTFDTNHYRDWEKYTIYNGNIPLGYGKFPTGEGGLGKESFEGDFWGAYETEGVYFESPLLKAIRERNESINKEIERLDEIRANILSERTKEDLEKIIEQKKSMTVSAPPIVQMYNAIEHEKSESHADIFDTRWDFLRGQFAKNKERLEYFQGLSSDLLGEDWVQEEYEETLRKLEKIKTAIHTLRGEDGYDYDKHDGAINRIGGEFEKVAISIDEAIKKAKEFEREVSEGAENVEERNRVALGHLFGEDFEWNKDGTAKTPKTTTSTEKAPLEGRLTRMAYNFRQASQSANQFSGVLTKLFSIVGTGNALNDMITASSLRQTNQIMLASSRGMEEAKKLYDRIQMLVVKLPGNDTFLTNILTMLGTMDKSLSAQDLEYMGGVIADYYMGAQAKGQFNNETERELRNYLMTGQTRNLTNSIIASEIESLKGLNSVKERTVALEKALQATGMDSIAHYDSYTNSLEEFKGRFQKAFADLGDLYLGFLQGGMKVYNFLDSLTNSALSQFVITIAVSVMGLLAFFGIMAELLSMSAGLIEAFDTMNKLIIENDKEYSGMAQTFRKVITWIAYKTGVVNADTASQVINTDATIRSTLVEGIYVRVLKEGIYARLKSIANTVRDTVVRYANAYATYKEADAMGRLILVTMEGNEYRRIGTLFKYASIIATKASTLNNWIETKSVMANTRAYLANTGARISNYLTKKLKMDMPEDIDERNKLGMDALFGNEEAQEVLFSKRKDGEGFLSALIRVGIPKLKNGVKSVAERSIGLLKNVGGAIARFLATPLGEVVAIIGVIITLIVLAVRYVGQLFGWWTSFGEMFQAIGDGLRRTWDAFMNSEPIQYIITTFQNLTYTLGTLFNWITSIGGNIWQTIFGVDDGSKSQVFDIVGVFLEVVGFIGKIAFMTSPLKIILDIINAIGSAIAWFLDTWNQFVDSAEFQGIIKDFQEIRAVIGEAWSTLSEAFNEVREAFMSVFEDDEDMKNAVETTNILLDVLRAVATFLRVTIIPIIKFIAYVIKGIADVIKFVVDIGVGVIDFFTGGSLTQDSSNLVNQSQLAQSYSHQISNAQTIINNNFASGSVLTDARNMTAKEVMKLFTSAFGFNKSRGVNGVLN